MSQAGRVRHWLGEWSAGGDGWRYRKACQWPTGSWLDVMCIGVAACGVIAVALDAGGCVDAQASHAVFSVGDYWCDIFFADRSGAVGRASGAQMGVLVVDIGMFDCDRCVGIG